MFVAISSGGSYVTTDGGKDWKLFSLTAIPTNDKARKWMAQMETEMANPPPAMPEIPQPERPKDQPFRLWTNTSRSRSVRRTSRS